MEFRIGKGSAEKLVSFFGGRGIELYTKNVENCERKIGGNGDVMKEFVGGGRKYYL